MSGGLDYYLPNSPFNFYSEPQWWLRGGKEQQQERVKHCSTLLPPPADDPLARSWLIIACNNRGKHNKKFISGQEGLDAWSA